MGLSFHYRGRLNAAPELPKLIDEVEDICRILNWKHLVFNVQYPDGKFISPVNDEDYGIVFTPPSCEPVCLAFDSEGKLYTPWLKELIKKQASGELKVISVKLNLNDSNPEPVISENNESFDPEDILYSISVKTQNAGSETHIKVMELLRYLSEKYLAEFKILDESHYWETRDPENLNNQMDTIHHFMDTFHDMISKEKIQSQDDFMSFLKKLSLQIKKKDKSED